MKSNNELIAEFMGYTNTTPTDKDFNIFENAEGKMLETMSMQYHKSWDWLMPVVEKIHQIKQVKIYGTYRDVEGESVQVIWHRSEQTNLWISAKIEYGRRFKTFTHIARSRETMLEPTYRFVVEFIKWYNAHK